MNSPKRCSEAGGKVFQETAGKAALLVGMHSSSLWADVARCMLAKRDKKQMLAFEDKALQKSTCSPLNCAINFI
eukprot:1156753-Pelagomonas_calceolata.AAC.3